MTNGDAPEGRKKRAGSGLNIARAALVLLALLIVGGSLFSYGLSNFAVSSSEKSHESCVGYGGSPIERETGFPVRLTCSTPTGEKTVHTWGYRQASIALVLIGSCVVGFVLLSKRRKRMIRSG